MSKYYPPDVGVKINKSSITDSEIQDLVNRLPNNVIFRVFGFAGTGKGTLSSNLATALSIPNVESSLIWRAITLIYEDLGLGLEDKNSDLVLAKLQVVHGAEKQLLVKYDSNIINRVSLKSPLVDSKVATYSANSYLREKFYDLMIDFLSSINCSCVLDGRGAYPRYITGIEERGYKIIRLLLDASESEMAQRYYASYINKKLITDPDYVESASEKQLLLENFNKGIIARNDKDWETWNRLDLGTITEDTAIVDTTGMSIDEVFQSVLSYINSVI
ncbi:MAG: (d)CMP kinase [Patescibacteria group bacterium]